MTTPTLREAALKPCPFCGKDHMHLEQQFGDESGYIRCRNCGAQSGRVYWTAAELQSEDYSASEAAAIEAWNRRAALAPPVADAPLHTAVRLVLDATPEQLPMALDALRDHAGAAPVALEAEPRSMSLDDLFEARARYSSGASISAFRAGAKWASERAAAQPQQPAPLTDAQITAAARALNKRHAELCNVNEADSWNLQADDFKADARAALAAAGIHAPESHTQR